MFLEQLQQLRLKLQDQPFFVVVNEFLVGLMGIQNSLVSENLSVIPFPSIVWKTRMRQKRRYTIRRKLSHRFGNEGQAMAWLGMICSLPCRNSFRIDTVVSNNCYYSIICSANSFWQESELLTYFYLTRFPTEKREFQNRFETHSRYSHNGLLKIVLTYLEFCYVVFLDSTKIIWCGNCVC